MADENGREDSLKKISEDTGDAFATARAKGSQYFVEQAKKGEDISDAVPGLIDTYFSTHQVPAMDPAAEALTRHWLSRGEMAALKKMIGEAEYTNSFSKAFEKIAEDGGNLIPAIAILTQLLPADEYLIAHSALAFCTKNPGLKKEFLQKFAAAILAEKSSKKYFFRLCKELQYKGAGVGDLIPFFDPLIADPETRKEAATTLHWLVEPGADLSAIEPQLRSCLSAATGDTAFSLGYVLVYDYLNRGRFDAADQLLLGSRGEALEGCLHAFGVKFFSDKSSSHNTEIMARVVPFLSHAEKKISERALSICEQAAKKQKAYLLPEDILLKLMQQSENEKIAQFLFRFSELTPGRSAIEASLPKIGSVAARRVGEILAPHEKTAGPLCGICQKIKRRESYSSEHSVPEEFRKLSALGYPPHGLGMSLYSCPECGMFYEYSYQEEWDDMSHFETYILNRLSTVEAEKVIPAEKIAGHEASLRKLEALWLTRIRHPVLWVRQEAAWLIGDLRIKNRQWPELEVFFRDVPEIRKEIAALLLQYSGDFAFDEGFRELIERKLRGDAEGIESDLAKSLAMIYKTGKNDAGLDSLLQSPDPVLQLAALTTLWLAGREGYPIVHFVPFMKTLNRSKNKDVRRSARYALDEAKERGELKDDADSMTQILADLQGQDAELREEACDALEKLVQTQSILTAIPALAVQLAKSETRWHAHRAIRAALINGQRIDAAIPALLALVSKKPYADRADELWTLRDAQLTGHDISNGKPVFLKMLHASRTQPTTVEILRGLFEAGKITEADIPPIEKLMLKRQHDGYSEAAGYIVFDHYRKKNDFVRMREMLTHENRNVRGLSCSRMADDTADLHQIGKFLEIFAENMTDKAWYVRVCSGSCLEKYAALGLKEKAQVKDVAGKIPAKAHNKELVELRSALV